MKNLYSQIGWKYALFAILVNAVQIVLQLFLPASVISHPLFAWALTVVSIYVIGFPFLVVILGKREKETLEKKKMSFKSFVVCVFIGAGICGVGSLIGSYLTMFILMLFGSSADALNANPLTELMLFSDTIPRVLVVGILAPIFEELIFRKLLIDRTVKYGEGVAIVASGLMFGLFHGNFSQFFFATGLGIFWAYIYIRTGKVWYTILFHMIINLVSSVGTVLLMQNMPMDKFMNCMNMLSYEETMEEGLRLFIDIFPAISLYMAWTGFLALCALIGVVLFFCNLKKFYFMPRPMQEEKRLARKYAFANGGMIFFYLVTLAMFVIYYVSIIMMYS
ncbi:MAG: CPBP family intramembrane metalloprotease [Lachnospiraceae bacterium]|nr:CPBP family intramembrane metalloprotease [Lachnospiraceae bacterium]